jgi:hypothetical protein
MTDDLSNSLAGVSSLLTARPEVQAGAWVYGSWGPRFISIDQMSTIG